MSYNDKTSYEQGLRNYEKYTYNEWTTLPCGFHERSDKSSFYFDIDGTTGVWYKDGRGLPLEEIINPVNHYFRDIETHPMWIEFAKKLHDAGQDVCIISAAYKDCICDKWEWIEDNMPFIPKENIFFAPIGADKSLFVKGNAEISVLFDDYNKNLDEWKGVSIKAINTVNSHQDVYAEIDFTTTEDVMKNFANRKLNPYADPKITENVEKRLEACRKHDFENAFRIVETIMDNFPQFKLASDIKQFLNVYGEYRNKDIPVQTVFNELTQDATELRDYLQFEVGDIDSETEGCYIAESLLKRVNETGKFEEPTKQNDKKSKSIERD